MAKQINGEGSGPRSQIQAIKACLDHLHGEATAHDMTLAAAFIGAASEAVGDEISKRTAMTLAYTNHCVH